MEFKFKKQAFQTEAVNAVADCFAGQPKSAGVTYRIDPGIRNEKTAAGPVQQKLYKETIADLSETGFKNHELVLTSARLLENIQSVQRRQNLLQSSKLVSTIYGIYCIIDE